jgi:hypothetical protein
MTKKIKIDGRTFTEYEAMKVPAGGAIYITRPDGFYIRVDKTGSEIRMFMEVEAKKKAVKRARG